MAYKNSSGQITIDEQAAKADQQKLKQAIEILETSARTLKNLLDQAASEEGQVAHAVSEKAGELRSQVLTLKGKLEETYTFISNVVAHYYEVDRQLKEAIWQSNIGGGVAGAAVSNATPIMTNPGTSIPGGAAKPAAQAAVSTQSRKDHNKKTPADYAKDLAEDIVKGVSNVLKGFG